MNTKRIVFLEWLRVIACLMVMTVHASECIYSNDYSFSFPSESARFSVLAFQSICRPIAVPLFILASVFLLVPVKQDSISFYKKRFTRVLIPLLVFLPIYALSTAISQGHGLGESIGEILHSFVNFPVSGSHLWFVYMLLGLYLIMPIISPWLEKASEKELFLCLGIWLFTCCLYRLRPLLGGDVFGECWWSPNPTFYYVSGFAGYIVLGYILRFHIKWSKKKIISICAPLFVMLYALCFISGEYYSTRVSEPAVMEQDWQNTTIIAAMMSFAAFMLISTIRCGDKSEGKSSKFYDKVIVPISASSYGMYLMHMLILPKVFKVIAPAVEAYLAIPSVALTSFLICFVISWLIGKLPFGKYIVG